MRMRPCWSFPVTFGEFLVFLVKVEGSLVRWRGPMMKGMLIYGSLIVVTGRGNKEERRGEERREGEREKKKGE